MATPAWFQNKIICGEVNNDGKVNIIDTLLIVQCYVGIEIELWCLDIDLSISQLQGLWVLNSYVTIENPEDYYVYDYSDTQWTANVILSSMFEDSKTAAPSVS